MELVRELGTLAIASRLKALSDAFYDAVDRAYAQLGCDIESRWFPLLQCVRERGPVTVTEAAEAIGQTHSAISQLCDRLVREGLLVRERCPRDGRRTQLTLSEEGEHRMSAMGPVWSAIRKAVDEVAGQELLEAAARCEAALAEQPLCEAIVGRHEALAATRLQIEPYRSEWRDAFYRLNAQWLTRYFTIEDLDERVLSDPERYILEPGGTILMATLDGEPVGTCAVMKESAGMFELTKMAVDESFQGMGIGRRLLSAAIDAFHELGGGRLFLESNSRLKAALSLYERAGFVFQDGIRPDSHYARADVYMTYRPEAAVA